MKKVTVNIPFNAEEYHKKYYQDHKERWKELIKQKVALDPHYHTKKTKKYRERHPECRKIEHLRLRYGLSKEQWNEMFLRQNGKCLICARHQNDLTKTLVVDHNHLTGKVRGLLCGICNTKLSVIEDVIFCSKATLYLQGIK